MDGNVDQAKGKIKQAVGDRHQATRISRARARPTRPRARSRRFSRTRKTRPRTSSTRSRTSSPKTDQGPGSTRTLEPGSVVDVQLISRVRRARRRGDHRLRHVRRGSSLSTAAVRAFLSGPHHRRAWCPLRPRHRGVPSDRPRQGPGGSSWASPPSSFSACRNAARPHGLTPRVGAIGKRRARMAVSSGGLADDEDLDLAGREGGNDPLGTDATLFRTTEATTRPVGRPSSAMVFPVDRDVSVSVVFGGGSRPHQRGAGARRCPRCGRPRR